MWRMLLLEMIDCFMSGSSTRRLQEQVPKGKNVPGTFSDVEHQQFGETVETVPGLQDLEEGRF